MQLAALRQTERIIRSVLARSITITYTYSAVDPKKEVSPLDRDDVGKSAPRILDSTSGRDFVLSVTRAKVEATDAPEALDGMVLWLKRLQPYFDFDPEMSVAQALQLYHKEHPKKRVSS